MYDLHVHTTASDGVLSPIEVICLAENCRLTGIAITDHDTLDGLEQARRYVTSKKLRIDFIPGVELNTDYGNDEVHILGYYVEDKTGALSNRLGEIKSERYLRAQRIVSRLEELGIHIDFEDVKRMASDDLIGRPHIARALCNQGYASCEQEAFDLYIARGKPGYVPRYKFTPEEAINLVKSVGGIAVLAHPGLIQDPAKIHQIIDWGIEGLEVYYPEHTQTQRNQLLRLALENNLLITGGSDFHGTGAANRSKLGCCGIDDQHVRLFKEFYQHKY